MATNAPDQLSGLYKVGAMQNMTPPDSAKGRKAQRSLRAINCGQAVFTAVEQLAEQHGFVITDGACLATETADHSPCSHVSTALAENLLAPVTALVSFADGTEFWVVESQADGRSRPRKLILGYGDVVFFSGDVVHRGSNQSTCNLRLVSMLWPQLPSHDISHATQHLLQHIYFNTAQCSSPDGFFLKVGEDESMHRGCEVVIQQLLPEAGQATSAHATPVDAVMTLAQTQPENKDITKMSRFRHQWHARSSR